MRKLMTLCFLLGFWAACSESTDTEASIQGSTRLEASEKPEGSKSDDRKSEDRKSEDSGKKKESKDSVQIRVKDSLEIRIKDSLEIHIKDSVVIRDSVTLNIVDSVEIRDSVALYSVDDILGKCTDKTAGQTDAAIINGERRVFVCDKLLLMWRAATMTEVTDFYIEASKVMDFVDVTEVYENLADDESVIFILRHAERGEDYSRGASLNEAGMEQSEDLGASISGNEEFYYGASEFKRAHQTCQYFAKGHGFEDVLPDTIPELNDLWYVKDEDAYEKAKDENNGGWNTVSMYVYNDEFQDAFYPLGSRTAELIEDVLLPAASKSGMRVGLFVSHDMLIMPLVSYVSGGAIDLNYHATQSNENWPNYLSGVAVVVKPNGTRVYYAVKGLSSGTMS